MYFVQCISAPFVCVAEVKAQMMDSVMSEWKISYIREPMISIKSWKSQPGPRCAGRVNELQAEHLTLQEESHPSNYN